MRILYCIDHLRADGTQRFLTQLVAGLSARGHQQSVLCLSGSFGTEVVTRLKAAHADVQMAGKLSLLSGYGALRTWRRIKDQRFDVGVTLLFASDVIGRTLMHAAGVPHVVSSLRARNAHYTLWQRWLVRRTMRWADAVVLNSETVRDFAISEEGARPDRIRVISNGVRIEEYDLPVDRRALRNELDLPLDARLIGSVGRLTRQKGYDLLLQSLALVARSDIHVLLIGTGEEEANLRKQADALGLASQIHFAGYRRDVPRLLNALDLYVQPSRFEGMPNALLEAMAARCVIVVSAVDGNRELIQDGVQGWRVPPENPARLAEAIQAALGDPAEAQRRACAAQSRVAAQFSEETLIDAWERAFRGEA